MIGFFALIQNDNKYTFSTDMIGEQQGSAIIEKQCRYKHNYFLLRTNAKFMQDKLFFNQDDQLFILDGVVLNKKQLMNQSKNAAWEETVRALYQKNDLFYNSFRGTFYGAYAESEKVVFFTDHIGSKSLFYYAADDFLIVSSNPAWIIDYLKKNGFGLELNIEAAYHLLTFAFMIDEATLTKGIKRIMPGSYLSWQNGMVNTDYYYRLSILPRIDSSETEIINEVDKRFREAVTRAFEKDREYGYKHIATLSGGLDSRMTVWVAHQLGYDNLLDITFSESDYLDEKIAKKIARDLKDDWLFKALDNGNFLMDIDETLAWNPALSLYSGSSHFMSMLKLLDVSKFGIFHTGQIGDSVIGGGFLNDLSEDKLKCSIHSIAYSKTLLAKTRISENAFYYSQGELFRMYLRGFNGANTGLRAIQQFSETYSPFADIDFMEYAFKIPIKLRKGHYIYKKWMIEKYPEAAEYIWEHDGLKPNKLPRVFIKYKGTVFSPREFVHAAVRKINRIIIPAKNQRLLNMNPFDHWYATNETLRRCLTDYFEDHIALLDAYPELQQDCKKLFSGTAIEKTQVITLLGFCKNYLS